MSKNNNSVTSINSYALALYELSEETNLVDVIEDQANQIINLISKSEDFKLFIKDPTSKQDDKINAINTIPNKNIISL